jgi:hypothetical protein
MVDRSIFFCWLLERPVVVFCLEKRVISARVVIQQQLDRPLGAILGERRGQFVAMTSRQAADHHGNPQLALACG